MRRTTQFTHADDVEKYIEELVKFAERAPFYQTHIEAEIESLRREIEAKLYQQTINGSFPPQQFEAVSRRN